MSCKQLIVIKMHGREAVRIVDMRQATFYEGYMVSWKLVAAGMNCGHMVDLIFVN